MKKILPFIFILFTTTLLAQAPQCHWVTRLTGDQVQSFTAVQTNNKGEIYAAGFVNQNTQIESFCDTSEIIPFQNFSSMLVKLSAAGDPIWRKDFNQGGGYNAIRKILLDKNDNIYITGNCYGPVDFNLDENISSDLAPYGLSDLFLIKYDSFGNYQWGRRFGGATDFDISYLIDFSPDSNIIISGTFGDQVDFGNPNNPIVFATTGEQDNFTAKINSLDGSTIWAKQVGGISFDDVISQTIDQFGNIYLVGLYMFNQTDVDPSDNIQLTEPIGDIPMRSYILKLSNQGDFIWVKQYEGFNTSTLSDIQIGTDNSFYTYGVFSLDADYDFSPTNVVTANDSTMGTFLAKYDLDGNFNWVKSVGSSGYSGATGWEKLVIGLSGNIYITGFFSGTNDFDPGNGQAIITTPDSAFFNPFIVCFNPLGDFEWVKTIRNPELAWGFGLAVDSLEKNFYLPGEFPNVSEFEPGNNQFTYEGGFYDGFIAKYSFCDRIINKAYVETCEPFYEIAGQTLDSSGFYAINNRSIQGCDSITCLTLKLNEASSQLSFQSCNAVEVNGQIYESSGIYQQIFNNGTTCDSVLVIQVAISSPTSTTLNIDDCDPISINGITYSTSGQFTQLLQNAGGCDSILTINAEILNLNAQIFQTDSTLYVNGSPTSIQWINCTTGQVIPGATQTSFVPQTTGNYGAVITIGECVDTSNCRQIIKGTAAEKPGSLCDNLIVTPNPVNDQIEFTLDKSSYDIRLFTSTGALIISTKGNAQKQIINFQDLARAMYVLQVDECRFKIVKQ
jgi:hypothetical protein